MCLALVLFALSLLSVLVRPEAVWAYGSNLPVKQTDVCSQVVGMDNQESLFIPDPGIYTEACRPVHP